MDNTHKSTTENSVTEDGASASNTGLSLPTENRTHGATTLVAPGSVMTTDTYKAPNFHSEVASMDMTTYLARPRLISGGTFVSGSTASIYNKYFLPSYLASLMPNLAGAFGFRATVCLRVEIAAAPQTAGIVRMANEYLAPGTSYSKSSYRPIIAQLPGSEVNLRSGSCIETKTPFISDRDFWMFVNGTYTNANGAFHMSIFPYAPVVWDTTVVSAPTWNLYIWFEDVELISKSMATVAVTPQAGIGPEADHGKVSTWFRYASKLAMYASSIPTLSSLALPVGWAFDAGSKIAAHFGWSKPNDGSYTGIMGNSLARGINTCADADFANPMGYYANNEVAVLPGFAGNDMDEMSLCYLTCKPGLIASCQLLPTDARNAVKWVTPVAPAAFAFQSSSTGFAQLSTMGLGSTATSGNKPGYFPTPVCFFASFFERWRGDLIFRFKFNTTKFHAGKLVIGYVPGEDVTDGVTAGGFSQAPNPAFRYDFHSVVVDLRTTSEIDFEVPFTYPSAWCDTGMALNYQGSFPTPNTGSVFVRILDPLYGPDNVPQTATMLVEVLAKCGLEFSQPITSIMQPLDPMDNTNVVVAQSAISGDFDATTYSTGERILSIKQLAMRPYWTTLVGNKVIPFSNLCYHFVNGWVPQAGSYNVPTNSGDTVLSRLSSCFALVRGGLVIRMVPALNGDDTTTQNWWSFVQWAIAGVQDIRGCAFSIENRMANMVRIPYYGKNSRMRTGWSLPTTGVNPHGTTRSLTHGNAFYNDSECIYGVSAADDYQLGCFTGVPPCVTFEPNNSTSASENYLRRAPLT